MVHAVLLKPLAYRDPGRLFRLYTEFPTFPNGGLRRFWTSPPEYYELSHELQSWESLDAWVTSGVNLAGATDPIRVTSCLVTGGLFQSLGVPPILGRAVMPQDDVTGAPVAIVIGYDLWQRIFAGDRGVLGRTIQVSGRQREYRGSDAARFCLPAWGAGSARGVVGAAARHAQSAAARQPLSVYDRQAEAGGIGGCRRSRKSTAMSRIRRRGWETIIRSVPGSIPSSPTLCRTKSCAPSVRRCGR